MKKLAIYFIALLLWFAPYFLFGQTPKNYQDSLLVIDYQFSMAKSFTGELAAVMQKSRWGFIDKNGNIVVVPQFKSVSDFKDGLARVSKGGRHGFINTKGVLIGKYKFLYASDYSENLAAVKLQSKWGYVDKKGNTKIPFQFDAISDFSEGLAAVKRKKKWGYIDKTGNEVIKYQYDYSKPFSEGLGLVKVGTKWGYIDKNGNVIIDFNYDEARFFSEDLAAVKKYDRWGYINKFGETVIDFQFDTYDVAMSFSEGFAMVKKGTRWGYINKLGNIVIDIKYDEAKNFSEKLAPVKKEGHWGYIDNRGETLVKFQFENAQSFTGNLALVRKGNKYGYISSSKIIFGLAQKIKNVVLKELELWPQKRKYESANQYQTRIKTEKNELVLELTKSATQKVANEIVDLKLLKTEYDPNNQIFKLVTNGLTPFYVKVPNQEASEFDENLKSLVFENRKFLLGENDLFMLSCTGIVNSKNQKKYFIDTQLTQVFKLAKIDIIIESNEPVSKIQNPKPEIKLAESDVDINIPNSNQKNENAFALIIGNENYSREISVPYAINDASTFYRYTENVLGVPKRHIHFLQDATYGQLLGELDWIEDVIKAYEGDAKVYVYYAGHGLPDAETRSAYILPIDGYSGNLNTSIKLSELYKALTMYPTKNVSVFLDACFTGGSRSGMLTAGRGVRIKPKDDIVEGNIVILSATSEDETAHPYDEKGHGLFTYFLLKKLQSSNGELDWQELSSYIIKNVNKESVVNNRTQTPSIIMGKEIKDTWEGILIK